MLFQLSSDVKNKFAATSWMNNLAGGNNNNSELLRMTAEREEENQKNNEKKFGDIMSNVERFKLDVLETLESMKKELTKKVGINTLEDQEERLQDLLDKIMQNINKRFTEKVDAKKKFAALDKQIKSVLELFLSKMDEQDVNEAMLAKKPLGGYSCVSCQKGITNIQG